MNIKPAIRNDYLLYPPGRRWKGKGWGGGHSGRGLGKQSI